MSKQTQHQLPAGKARMKCCLWRTYMSPAEAFGSLPDSWPPLHQDPHPSLHLVSPSATLICSCSRSPPSMQSQLSSPLPWTNDAHLVFPLSPQFPACLSPASAVTVWRSGGDTCAAFSLPCWQLSGRLFQGPTALWSTGAGTGCSAACNKLQRTLH